MKSIFPILLLFFIAGFGSAYYFLGYEKSQLTQYAKPSNKVEPVIMYSTGMNPIIDRDKICSNFVETATGISFPGSDLYPIYKNIISNKEAQKDWVTINNTFIQKSCVFDKDDPEEFKLCELFTKSDIVGINNDPDTIQSDKGIMLSIIKSTNECSGDESCEFYVNIVNNIKKKIKPTKLPDLSGSRLIEWYVYKKLFSDEYDTNVSKLFLENCLKL